MGRVCNEDMGTVGSASMPLSLWRAGTGCELAAKSQEPSWHQHVARPCGTWSSRSCPVPVTCSWGCRELQRCWMLHSPHIFSGCRRLQGWCCPSSRSQEVSFIKWFLIPGLLLHAPHVLCMGKVTFLPLHCCSLLSTYPLFCGPGRPGA